MHMPPRDNTSFDDFLSHLKDPRVHKINTTEVWLILLLTEYFRRLKDNDITTLKVIVILFQE